MSLLTVLIVKSIHILAGISFIFLTERPRPNFKGFQYQIWTSVKKSGEQLSTKTNYCFLQINQGLRLKKMSNKSNFRGSRLS